MKVLQLFNLQNVDESFRSSYLNDKHFEFNLSTEKDTNILEVKGEGVFERYVLVKITYGTKQNTLSPSVVQPKFVIDNKKGEKYGAFEVPFLDKLVRVSVNDHQQLKLTLKNLAEIQAKHLISSANDSNHSEYTLEHLAKSITILDKFKSIEEPVIATTLETLQIAVNKLLQSNLVVPSNWLSSTNIYINTNNSKVVFLQTSSGQLLPPAFDAFTCIFSLTTEKFRQHNFEDLAKFYFQSLTNALKGENHSIADSINEMYIETQTHILLPVAKIAVANNAPESEDFQDLLSNIANYFKYSELNQEDVYHAIKTKLSSSDFDLLSYSIKRLIQNNGHLGDYFHLKIAVKFQNKEEVFNLFAKILNNCTDAFTDLIEKGLGKKEKFFYITLCGLFEEYGLRELMDFAPKCYMSGLKGIILDDLTSLGYTSLTPNTSLNYNGIRVILEKLAKFHACSLIIEELLSKEAGRDVRLGEKYSEYLEEALVVEDGSIGDFMYHRFQSIFILFDKVPELTKDLNLTPREIETKLAKVRQSLFERVRTSKTIRNVIHHGDMHVSNMLFKFANDNSVLDGILVDFQILRYMPPAYEAQFFINVCSSQEARKYQTLLLDEYYDNVSSYLKKFDLNPERIYSRNNYDIDLQNTKSAALLMAYCYGVLLYADPKFREEILHDEAKMKYYLEYHQDKYFEIVWKSENYRNRLTGLVRNLIKCVENDIE